MKKLIILVFIVIVMITIVFLYLKPHAEVTHNLSQVQQTQSIGTSHEKLVATGTNVIPNSSQHDNLQIMKPIEGNTLTSTQLPENYKDTAENYLFAFDHQVLAAKQVNDHVQIQMLQFGLNREGVIQSKVVLDDGIVRWRGRFEGYPEDINYFTITQAEQDHYAVMKVFTDKGAYIAEIKNGVGLATPIGEGIGHDDHLHSEH